MNKKILTLLAAILLAFSLVACTPTSTQAPTAAPASATAPAPTATAPAPTATLMATPQPTRTLTPTPIPTPTPVPSLSGRVTDAGSGQGIVGATVEVRPAGGWGPRKEWDYSATTTFDGSYALFGIFPGDYVVRVTAPGYAREYYDNVSPYLEAKIIHVSALSEIPGIDFQVTEGGSISGHIYQSDGVTPIPGAEVFVRPSKYRFDAGFWTSTDSNGGYSVENLPLGNYRVTAEAEGYVGGVTQGVKYYNDVYGWSNAWDVKVTPPGNTPGIDINLELAGSISGFVYTSDGVTPIPDVHLIAGCTSFEEGLGGFSNSDGSYTISGLPPGNYKVRTQGGRYANEFYDSRNTQGTADQVVISAGHNTPNVNFTLDEGGLITGRVFDEVTREPLLEVDLWAFLPDGDLAAPHGVTSVDGSYEIELKPGEYLIWIGGPLHGSGYIHEWYDNAYEMSRATLVTVNLHQETSGIDFYLARSGSISGHVYDKAGNPISGARVYAFSEVYPGNGANTADDGSYTIEGLLPGAYTVQVAVSGFISEYYNDMTDQAQATPVIVIATENTPGVDFHLARQTP